MPALLGRTLAAGQRALVRLGTEARVAALDGLLWASTDPAWLPHGTARTGHGGLQPIWLTTGEDCPNGARYLFLLDGLDGGRRGRSGSTACSICSTAGTPPPSPRRASAGPRRRQLGWR